MRAIAVVAICMLAAAPAAAEDEWSLFRVDVPDFPGALTSSDHGSMLESPPEDGTPWRIESIGIPNSYDAYEAKEALGTEAWFAAGKGDGTGVKVAVFDLQWADSALRDAELGAYTTHDCYTHRSCDAEMDSLRERFSFEQGSHGVACAEVIRDLAPGVTLYLVRVNGLTTLEKAAAWAVRNEIDLVSLSLSFFDESFFDGSGPVSEVVGTLAAADVLLVTSAGNYADAHWLGAFEDDDLDGFHRFDDTEYLPIYFASSGYHRVTLNWDEFSHCGDTDLDLYIYDEEGLVVGKSEDEQLASQSRCEPVERVKAWVEAPGWYYASIRRDHGTAAAPRVALMARSGWVYGATPGGSVADPGAHPLAFAVGAVEGSGYLTNDVEAYSSQGPSRSGTPKPDIVGPDGLSTRTYGERGFYGTSAAAPAVTAALALMMSEDPNLGSYEAAQRLAGQALAPTATWAPDDSAAGAGYARLYPKAVSTPGCQGRALLLSFLLWFPLSRIRRTLSSEQGPLP